MKIDYLLTSADCYDHYARTIFKTMFGSEN
jgi:hypothetical protein